MVTSNDNLPVNENKMVARKTTRCAETRDDYWSPSCDASMRRSDISHMPSVETYSAHHLPYYTIVDRLVITNRAIIMPP